jgi:ubiquinone/menaquinone biosynthesis C-methylase UbiE
MKEADFGSYEELASEYYDAGRHPTCANFREASATIIRRWLSPELGKAGWICEVGAGKSLVAEILSTNSNRLDYLVITDASPSMIAYSQPWAKLGARLVVAPANQLPLPNKSVSCLISSLGDPYNEDEFWQEAHRVLIPGGRIVFTTPSAEWAMAFRAWSGSATFEGAEFELSSGRHVYVRSIIYTPDQQLSIMERAGFRAIETTHVRVSDLETSILSPKLRPDSLSNPVIVTGYIAARP